MRREKVTATHVSGNKRKAASCSSTGNPHKAPQKGGGRGSAEALAHERQEFFAKLQALSQPPDVSIENGKLVIKLLLFDAPWVSRYGKKRQLVASSRGVRETSCLFEDLPIHVTATAFIYDHGETVKPLKFEPLF